MSEIKPNLHYGMLYKDDRYVRQRFQIYADFLRPYLHKGVKILDVGGYTADILNFLPSGIDYHLVDFDKEALEIAKTKGANVKKIALDLEDIAFDNQKFDIIIATEVLEHLQDPIRHIKRIKELVNDNGVVLISLPNENTIYHRLMSLFGFGIDICAFQLYKHLHLPTIKQSTDFISQHFRIIRVSYYINPGCRRSRFEGLGKILTVLPDVFWKFGARIFPSLLARGVIFLCVKP